MIDQGWYIVAILRKSWHCNAVFKLQSTKQFTLEAFLTSFLETSLRKSWNEKTQSERKVPHVKELLEFLRRKKDAKDDIDSEYT